MTKDERRSTENTEKVKKLLDDITTHRLLDTDPTEKLEKEINEILGKLQDIKRITKEDCSKMREVASNAAQFYGLP